MTPDAQLAPHGERVDDIDLARAQEYTLLSNLLLRSPDAPLLRRLQQVCGDGSTLGVAHQALADAAARVDAQSVSREYFELFIGLGRGELLPYASYYLTGSMHARPLANVRLELQRLGIERADGQSEPEDHAGILLEIMAGLSGGTIPGPAGIDQRFFEAHLAPWMGAFFSDLERQRSGQFYAAVGMLGTTFLDIERQGFSLTRSG